jgi:hypothetical protein
MDLIDWIDVRDSITVVLLAILSNTFCIVSSTHGTLVMTHKPLIHAALHMELVSAVVRLTNFLPVMEIFQAYGAAFLVVE